MFGGHANTVFQNGIKFQVEMIIFVCLHIINSLTILQSSREPS